VGTVGGEERRKGGEGKGREGRGKREKWKGGRGRKGKIEMVLGVCEGVNEGVTQVFM